MGRVFGGFTDIPWQTEGDHFKYGTGNTFIFSLRDDFNFVKLKCLNKMSEVCHDGDFLTAIGDSGSGFWIIEENLNPSGFSFLGDYG
jgi:hypothetical protein